VNEAPRPIPQHSARRTAAARSVAMPRFQLQVLCVLISILALEYSTYLIRSATIDAVVKMASLAMLLIFERYYLPGRRMWIVLALYAALFATSLVGALSVLDPVGLVQAMKLALCALILPLVVLRFPTGAAVPRRLLFTPIIWGLFFAVQGLVLFTLITVLNVVPSSELVPVGRLENMTERSYGLLGYGNTLTTFASGRHSIRPQGWMLEPSNLASFMLYPTFVSFGLYRSVKRKRYLLAALLSLAGLAVALSLAGYLSFIAALVLMVVIRPSKPGRSGRRRRPRGWLAFVGPVVAALLFLVVAQKGYSFLESLRPTQVQGNLSTAQYLLGRGNHPEIGGLVRNTWRIKPMFERLKENPLGMGLGETLGKSDLTSANAAVFWIMAGGVPALLGLAALHWYLFSRFCYPLLVTSIPAYRGVAAAFVAVTIHGLSYGHWMNPFYIVNIAIMILCANHVAEMARQNAVRPVPQP